MIIDVELGAEDLEFLQTAMGAETADRDASGVMTPQAVARLALGALCRRILANGYEPRPLAVHQRQGQQGELPNTNTIHVRIAGRQP